MVDAINTGNPVRSTFIVNKYDDIDGSRVNQETPRGRLCFKDTNGRMTLPRTLVEANKAVHPTDHGKPLNPGPYFEGAGLNGQLPNSFSDGSYDAQISTFTIDPDVAYGSWPVAYKIYDVPPALLNLPVASGNKVLVYDEGTFTFGSGNYVGVPSDYGNAALVYVSYASGHEGKLTASGAGGDATAVGRVDQKDVFGPNTITVKFKGIAAL